jgi:hypothetical protein
MDIMYVWFDDAEEAESVRERLDSGEIDFEYIVREQSPWLEEEDELPIFSVHEFIEEIMFDEEITAGLLAMQAGELSDFIPWGEEFGLEYQILVYVVSREEPDDDEIERSLRRDRIDGERHAMMMSLVPQWIDQADFTLNKRAFDLA